jgi:hypothetical protein
MPMQVITFKLDGIDDAAYQAHTEQRLPANPHLIEVAVSDFSVLAEPTKVTRGGY